MDNIDSRINELFSTIDDLSHAQNINRLAFNDIAKVILSFHDSYNQEGIKQVCDASPGHGKTTVLISYLKWLTKQHPKQPILVAVKEKHLAHEIYTQVSKVAPNDIINIDSDNKELYESDLQYYQIVIIQHQRLKNLALGFGNTYNYQYYIRNKTAWGDSNETEKIKRQLIIDEKPDFVDSAIFDINSENNVLDWFEDLAQPLKMSPIQTQRFKHYINFLLSEQLLQNILDKTTALLGEEYKNTIATKNLLEILKQMQEHEQNKSKYESLNKLKHFKKLLKEDGYGRIDDYEFYKSGRKIIVSKLIDYSKLKMNILIFDGTAKANAIQYIKAGYNFIHVENRNNYSRLYIQVDSINTTKYSRTKEGYPTQKAIANRIKSLQKVHNDLFVLPMKDEIEIYKELGVINDSDYPFYKDTQHEKGIHLLNTTGKNVLKDRTAIYLTCLPKRNADYYKQIAIALFGNDVMLHVNNETDKYNWFQDEKLEMIYRSELYAELLQIIHRTALRKINDKEPIYIYMAYDEESDNGRFASFKIEPISLNLTGIFLKGANLLPPHQIVDMSLYNRDKTLEKFILQVKNKMKELNKDTISANSVSNAFKKYLHNHWNSKESEIKKQFRQNGLEIYVDYSDKRKPKRIKRIN
jgi:hypothetical protein